MNNYSKGYYYEKKTRRWLYNRGAITVVESRGSHGSIDMVAFFEGGSIWVVQVKSGKQLRITQKELDELYIIAQLHPLIDSMVLYWQPRMQVPFVYNVVRNYYRKKRNWQYEEPQ